MSEREWKLGDHVRFNWDGLNASGIIIKIKSRSHVVIVLLDDGPHIEEGYGWNIGPQHEVDYQYFGRKGWNVPMDRLKPKLSKLGNEI